MMMIFFYRSNFFYRYYFCCAFDKLNTGYEKRKCTTDAAAAAEFIEKKGIHT